jgi:hypothetical protein
MTRARSKQLGKALMALSVVQVLCFLVALTRRSYAALAIPVLLGVAIVSGLAFWVGWTMSAATWDDEA